MGRAFQIGASMRCIFCKRSLKRAEVMLDGHPVGPDCAKKHNLLAQGITKRKHIKRAKKVKAQHQPERCPDTLDLFENVSI